MLRTASYIDETDITSVRLWNPHAVITNKNLDMLRRVWPHLECPVVNMFGPCESGSVEIDEAAVGETAADYFLERGFRRFAYVGTIEDNWSMPRRDAYAAIVAQKGYSTDSYSIPSAASKRLRQQRWLPIDSEMCLWIRGLAKEKSTPIAVFCGNDLIAREVATACMTENIKIPDEMSLLSVDDDEFCCLASRPYLSSIVLPWEQAGLEAAKAVERLVSRTGSREGLTTLIRPVSVTTRQSSSLMAVGDKQLAAALAYIEAHACDPITVKQLLKAVPVDRRWLERQFRNVLQRSPHDEIRRVRIERAKVLLSGSRQSIPEVAAHCGFSEKLFSEYFKRDTGTTPMEFRRQSRGI